MKIKLTIAGLIAIALFSSFLILKNRTTEKPFTCTCGKPSTPHKLSRSGSYVTIGWTAAAGNHINHYNYLYYLNHGGTFSGTTGASEQITINDYNEGGTIVVTPICQDVTQPFPYPQCTGTQSAGGWTSN